jgi:dihydroxy-acid dehydratase
MLRTAKTRLPSRSFSTTAQCADKPILNRYSRIITQPKDQGASQVHLLQFESSHSLTFVQAMLYATDGIKTDDDFDKAMVGVASVW